MGKKSGRDGQSGKALALHSEGQGFDPEGRNQICCGFHDKILNYDISDFDLRDRTLALRSAKREL